jgi:hypothetical protein
MSELQRNEWYRTLDPLQIAAHFDATQPTEISDEVAAAVTTADIPAQATAAVGDAVTAADIPALAAAAVGDYVATPTPLVEITGELATTTDAVLIALLAALDTAGIVTDSTTNA